MTPLATAVCEPELCLFMGSTRLHLRSRRHDTFFTGAKREGYPSRSVFKLREIDKRFQILRAGQRVLDLGFFPGSWSIYAASRVGERGLVVGVDQRGSDRAFPRWVRLVVADVAGARLQIRSACEASFDVVLSDMAPRTSGNRDRDQRLSSELFFHALSLSLDMGRPGGDFVGKIFMGPDLDGAIDSMKAAFRMTSSIRAAATRKGSREIYLVGKGRLENPGGAADGMAGTPR